MLKSGQYLFYSFLSKFRLQYQSLKLHLQNHFEQFPGTLSGTLEKVALNSTLSMRTNRIALNIKILPD